MDDSVFSKIWNTSNEKPSTTFRFFERQEYYTVHYEDATFIAKNYFKSLEVIKYYKGNSNCPYINISKNVSPSVFQYLLIKNRYKIEMYACQARDTSNWNLLHTVSPGNLENYQDTLFPNVEIVVSNNLVAINIKKIHDLYRVYLGFVDLDNNQMILGYFDEDYGEYKQLSNLNSVLFQLNCRECLIPKSNVQATKSSKKSITVEDPLTILRNTITQNGLLCSEIEKSQFEMSVKEVDEFSITTKLISRIKRFTNDKEMSSTESLLRELIDRESVEAANCLLAVIAYLSLESKDNDEGNRGHFEIKPLKLDNYMKITESCSQALNILPNYSDSGNQVDAKNETLYGLLNHCKTQLGERLLIQWLRQPLMDIRQINNRLDLVELLSRESIIRNSLYDNYLSRIPDIQRIIRRIQRKTVNLQDLYKLYLTLKQVSNIEKMFGEYDGLHKHVLHSEITFHLNELLSDTSNFMSMLESTLDFEAVKNHEYKIKPDIDEALMEKHEETNLLKNQIEKEFIKVAGYLGVEPVKQIKLESNNHLGYYLRITRKEEKILRGKKNISIKETQKDGVRFYSDKLEALNEDYKRINYEYDQLQKDIVSEIVNVSGGYLSALHKLCSIIARIDVLCSLSITVVTAPCIYTRPKLLDLLPTDSCEESQQHIKLTGCRHALVEMQPSITSYIPNDVEFNEKRSFHIITGPNMGGKSTYIRSVGLAVVLSQIGSFVPCESAEIRVCDRIMTRIGAGDCQIKGVSTFMAEMLDISWILKDCTKNSLVIIDELGRGTSTFDGFGLAWSISEFLATQKGAYCLFATHFHELTTLADLYPNKVANLSVSAKTMDEDLVFLYRVLEGAATKSYGIELAKLVGLPDDVIEMSRAKLKEYEYEEKFLFDEERLKRQKDVLRKFCAVNLDECDDLEALRRELLQSLT